MNVAVTVMVVLLIALAGLAGWRQLDRHVDRRTSDALIDTARPAPHVQFEPSMVDALPPPAQRYFGYMIRPGTPLTNVVELEMTGELGRGTKDTVAYDTMRARQVLAPPHGFVWQVTAGRLSGSDGLTPETSWTRFWLAGLAPVVRAGGNEDHRRSAFGRVVAEAAMWAPASLLPGPDVTWSPVDDDTARATVRVAGLTQAVDITVDADGQPTQVVIQRWSNENAAREFREQPFGGLLADFADFGGYRLPTRVEGGNHFGTDDFFPFFKAEVAAVRFPAVSDAP